MPIHYSKKIISAILMSLLVLNNTAFAEATSLNYDDSGIIYEDITPDDFYIDEYEDEYFIPDDPGISEMGSEILYTEESSLSEGLDYTRNLYYHKYGNQREYIIEYTPNEITKLNFAGNNYLYSVNNVKNMAATNYPDSNFVAGINGDFFNMSTGVPESAFIKNYELFTTDRDSFCLALDKDGKYFFDKPSIKLSITKADGTEINVAHLNKEFSVYALYLYNDRYSDTTHISSTYSQAVLLPFTDMKTFEEVVNDLDDSSLKRKFRIYKPGDEVFNESISKVEELTGFKYINGQFYKVTDVYPQIGKSEKLVVYETNNNCTNGKIPENAYLLCGDNTSYGYIPATLNQGEVLTLNVSGNELFENVVDAIGVGAIIVNDSKVIDNTSQSHYTSLQPRSAVGVKEDGSLVFYAIDGRQKNISSGLKLFDLGEKMKELGCTYAANLDGGGSTVVYASRPGYDTSDIMNKPSGGTERRVSNSFVFTNTLEKKNTPDSAYVYSDYYLTYPDWYINIDAPVISDENGFKYNPSDDENIDVNYHIDNGISVVVDGVLYPVGVSGNIGVFTEVNGVISGEKPAFYVNSITSPDTIEVTTDVTEISPFDTATLKADSFYKNLKVSSGPICYLWSVSSSEQEDEDEILGSVTDGIFYPQKAGKEIVVTASRGDVSGSVTIKVDSYPFSDIENHWAAKDIYKLAKRGVVNGYPAEGDTFVYLPENNYSRYEFCAMFDRMTDIGDNITVPDIFGKEVTDSANAELNDSEDIAYLPGELSVLDFADASDVPEWAYSSLYKLYFTDWLNEIMKSDTNGNLVFSGDDFITREDVMKVVGKVCNEVPADFTIDVYSDLNETQRSDENIKKCIYSGIFTGYEDMTLRLSNYLTRAEAATIFVRLQNYIENIDSNTK